MSFGAAIWICELGALPARGATPPLRDWPPREIALLLAHTLVFGVGAALLTREGTKTRSS